MSEFLLIRDPETDTDRKFQIRPRTRSVAEGLDAIDVEQLEYVASVFGTADGDDEVVDTAETRREAIELAAKSPEMRDRIVELQCKRLDLLCKPVKTKDDGELRAGELVARLWADDELADDWIDEWVVDAQKKSSKRPR